MKDKFIEKTCKTHGLTTFVLEGRGSYRCKKCRSFAVTKKRRGLKSRLVKEFGGECSKCGYAKCEDALQFHHTDPSIKSFGLSVGGLTLSYSRLLAEARKCVLLCANCHTETHSEKTED